MILLFDGVCNLCSGTVKFIIAHDKKGKIKFAALQSQTGQSLLQKFNLPANHFDTFVFIQGDQFYVKSSAALKVIKVLDGWPGIFYAACILPRPFSDYVYMLVAKTRYFLFGKRKSCFMATDEIKERFLV
jgi:predicted DCC family thiol-disulfide oxidoreductase YuxK